MSWPKVRFISSRVNSPQPAPAGTCNEQLNQRWIMTEEANEPGVFVITSADEGGKCLDYDDGHVFHDDDNVYDSGPANAQLSLLWPHSLCV